GAVANRPAAEVLQRPVPAAGQPLTAKFIGDAQPRAAPRKGSFPINRPFNAAPSDHAGRWSDRRSLLGCRCGLPCGTLAFLPLNLRARRASIPPIRSNTHE